MSFLPEGYVSFTSMQSFLDRTAKRVLASQVPPYNEYDHPITSPRTGSVIYLAFRIGLMLGANMITPHGRAITSS